MELYRRSEKSWKTWGMRLLIGPATVIDGIVQTISLGFISPLLGLKTAKTLARLRMKERRLSVGSLRD